MSEAPDPHSSEAPDPHSSEAPDPHSSEAPDPHSSEAPDPHSSEAQDPHSSEAPDPHSSAAPDPHSSAAPDPHSSAAPDPHSSAAPDPHSSAAPDPHSSAAPDPRSLVSAQLLLDLVNDTLDPGYAAAAKRRGPDARPQRWATPAVALGCALIGFLLVVSYVHTHRGAPGAAKVHDRLVERVRDAQDRADALGRQANGLDTVVSRLRDDALPQSGALAAQLDLYTLTAGQTKVDGPGMTVTLSDPKPVAASAANGRGGSVPLDSTNTLTDRDVRSVVNELWHDGAEAIAVNGVRLTPTSTVRFAGQVVLVDFQPVSSPYRVSAVGDADAMSVAFAQSSVASRYQTLTGVQGIGFGFTESGHLSLPAGAAATLRYATAARVSR